MTVYQSTAETAKWIRKALKEAFPSAKFSVRSSTYAGGSSIRVTWTDGPNQKAVEKIAGKFAGSYFDGMTDYKGGYVKTFNGQQNVSFGPDFVFVERKLTDAWVDQCRDAWGRLTASEQCDLLNNVDFPRYGRGFNSWEAEDEGKNLACFLSVPGAGSGKSPLADSIKITRSY